MHTRMCGAESVPFPPHYFFFSLFDVVHILTRPQVAEEVSVSAYLKQVGEHDPTAKAIRAKLYDVTVPCTTRPMRPGEVNGTHYNFVSRDEFQGFISADKLIEYGEHNGNFYGTLKVERKETQSLASRPGMKKAQVVEATIGELFVFLTRIQRRVLTPPCKQNVKRKRRKGMVSGWDPTVREMLTCAAVPMTHNALKAVCGCGLLGRSQRFGHLLVSQSSADLQRRAAHQDTSSCAGCSVRFYHAVHNPRYTARRGTRSGIRVYLKRAVLCVGCGRQDVRVGRA